MSIPAVVAMDRHSGPRVTKNSLDPASGRVILNPASQRVAGSIMPVWLFCQPPFRLLSPGESPL